MRVIQVRAQIAGEHVRVVVTRKTAAGSMRVIGRGAYKPAALAKFMKDVFVSVGQQPPEQT